MAMRCDGFLEGYGQSVVLGTLQKYSVSLRENNEMDTGLNSKASFILTNVCCGLYLYYMGFYRTVHSRCFCQTRD